MDTRELIEKARDGDRNAFGDLVELHREALRAFVLGELGAVLGRKVTVDDVLQESFFRAYRSLGRFESKGEGSFLSWLRSIAGHVVRDFARYNDRRPSVPLRSEVPEETVSPSRVLRREERFDRLRSALEKLSADHREVIELAALEGLPLKDIGRRMSRSPDAAKQLLFRATRKLKEIFGETESLNLPAEVLRLSDEEERAS